MKISVLPMNPFGMNCYILWNEPHGECIVIDPGMMTPAEHEMFSSFIDGNSLKVKCVLLTHCHVDHACAARWVCEKYDTMFYAGEAEKVIAQAMPLQAQLFGLKIDQTPLEIEHVLSEGDIVTLGDEELHVLETPGHSPGSLSFYCPTTGVIFVGDVIFAGSIGRTDLLGSSDIVLLDSIKTKVLTLPAETVIASGHGEATTVGDELIYNPYLQ